LAYIFPKSVVNEVIAKRDQQTEQINQIVEMWKNVKLFNSATAQATTFDTDVSKVNKGGLKSESGETGVN